MSEEIAQSIMHEAFKALLPGAIGGSIFYPIGLVYFSANAKCLPLGARDCQYGVDVLGKFFATAAELAWALALVTFAFAWIVSLLYLVSRSP